MASRRTRNSRALVTKSAQLALAAPQVIAQRATRMALAGASPSRRDRLEFSRMTSEKTLAFMESWNAMALQIIRTQQSFMLSWATSVWMPWLGPRITATSLIRQMQDAAVGLALSGMAPVHRAAVANARRLTPSVLP